jgi:hypothetical protein
MQMSTAVYADGVIEKTGMRGLTWESCLSDRCTDDVVNKLTLHSGSHTHRTVARAEKGMRWLPPGGSQYARYTVNRSVVVKKYTC